MGAYWFSAVCKSQGRAFAFGEHPGVCVGPSSGLRREAVAEARSMHLINMHRALRVCRIWLSMFCKISFPPLCELSLLWCASATHIRELIGPTIGLKPRSSPADFDHKTRHILVNGPDCTEYKGCSPL